MKYGNATEPFGTGASLTYEHAIGRQYTLDQASPWFSIPLAPGAAVGTSDLRYSGYWYKSQYQCWHSGQAACDAYNRLPLTLQSSLADFGMKGHYRASSFLSFSQISMASQAYTRIYPYVRLYNVASVP